MGRNCSISENSSYRRGLGEEGESVHVRVDVSSQGIAPVRIEAVLARAKANDTNRSDLTSNVARQRTHMFEKLVGFQPGHVDEMASW